MQVGGCVEYTKEKKLYRILIPSAHILLTFCIRIGAFDRSCVFGLVQVFSGSVHNYYRGLCPENRCRLLRLMTTAFVKPRVVLR